jgi:ribosomal protein L7/L12
MKVNLLLRERCTNKLMLVKILKDYTGLGLREAKDVCI